MNKSSRQLDCLRTEIERAVTSAMRALPTTQAVIVLPIFVECEFPKPRMPYRIWLVSQYRDYSRD